MLVVVPLLGCGSPEPEPRPPRPAPAPVPVPAPAPTTPPTPTPPTPTTPITVLSASCTSDPDAQLRARCEVVLSEAGPAEVHFSDGEEAVTFTDPVEGLEHVIHVWGLAAETRWDWAARHPGGPSVTGVLAIPALPDGVVRLDRAGDPSASEVRHFLAPMSCQRPGTVVAVDARGRLRWSHDFAAPDAPPTDRVIASALGDSGTVLANIGMHAIVEVDLTGTELFRKDDHPFPVHHDLARHGDLVWTLVAVPSAPIGGQVYVEDELVAFDRAGAVAYAWREAEHLDPTLTIAKPDEDFWRREFPGALDTWHTNGFSVLGPDDFLLSLKKADSLVRVIGGEIAWILAGDGVGEALPTTIALTGPGDPTFAEQHHPQLLPGGHVAVFDNGRGPTARGLELAVDPTTATASFVAEWPTGLACPVQSSILPLEGGHFLAACASEHEVLEFDAAGVEIGRFTAACDSGELGLTVRAQPVDLWELSAQGTTAHREPETP